MQTVAHYWLLAEQYAAQQFKIAKQPNWEKAAKTLDSVIDSCAQTVSPHDRPMKHIESHLENWKVDDSHSFGEALATKTGDCKIFTALYLAIGQTAGIPIWFELAPCHIMPTLKREDRTFQRHDTIYFPHLPPAKPDSLYVNPGTKPGIYLVPRPPDDFRPYVSFNLVTYLMNNGVRPLPAPLDYTLETFPDVPDVLRLRAMAHSMNNDFSPALNDINRAIAVAPKDAENYIFRALIYKKMGQTDKMLADRATIKSLPPPHRPANKLLDKIS